MGVRWRRPFCTSISRDPAEAASAPSSEKRSSSPSPSPRICARLGSFFSSSSSSSGGGAAGSSPSTPRLHSISTPTFRCRTDTRHPDSPKSSAARRPRTPPSSTRTRASSQPSSPISPSRFAIFKSSLRLSRSSRCGLCAHSVKRAAGDGGAAVFTAECSHAFHLACIAACNTHVCPVCSATWRHSYPLLSSSIVQLHPPPPPPQTDAGDRERPHLASAEKHRPQQQRSSGEEDLQGGGREGESIKPTAAAAALKVYNDDEPLLPSNASRGIFNPIPEADVEDDDLLLQGEEEASGGAFQGIFPVESYPPPSSAHHGHGKAAAGVVEVSVMPEAALVSAGRSHQNYVVAVTVKAPPPTVGAPLLDPSQRSPIDLVTVLDVRMSSAKVHMLKRAMRLLISSLGPADRLSIVAFSNAAAKRLLPLSRMWRQGQRSAHQIVNRLLIVSSQQGTPCSGVGDALRKATKVLEDRRDRNPVATIMLLSDGGRQQQSKADKMEEQQHRRYSRFRGATKGGDTTRFAHLDFPIHASSEVRKQSSVPEEEEEEEENPLVKCIFGGLMSVVLQDVHIQFLFPVGEISAVYSCGGGGRAAAALGGGRGGASFLLGDLYAGEERELLVELRVLGGGAGGPPPMSVKCSYRDGSTQELIRCREQHLNLPSLNQYNHNHTRLLRSSSNPNVQRLRNLFVATRAVADSRRLAGLNDFGTAVHLLSSARSLLLHSTISSYKDLVHSLDAEMADLQRRRQQQQQTATSHSPSQRSRWQALVSLTVDDEREALTPTSAWRAAERLAKLAIMRKSLNRISDLHGFENARF